MHLSEVQYSNHLNEVVKQLRSAGFCAAIRGQDTARFVYSKANERAIEISWAGDEGVYIEYWDGALEEAVKEECVQSFNVAVIKTISWLVNA